MSEDHAATPVHALAHASARLLDRVDAMTPSDWTAPSLLPGWSRSHVLAHLALNAEALTAALRGIAAGRDATMYASQEARDADIDRLAAAPDEIGERLRAGTSALADALADFPLDHAEVLVERVPEGRTFPAGAIAEMRWREVEIHHADLGLGYSWQDFSEEFVRVLLDFTSAHFEHGGGFSAYATDLNEEWQFGMGGPTVSGPGAALAWWSTGRDPGEDVLASNEGYLPRIEEL